MNTVNKFIISLFSFMLPLAAIAFDEELFLSRVYEIKSRLYKISAEELKQFLEVAIDAPPIISAEELKTALEENPDLYVINVLPATLHADCHITESMNVPLKELVDMVASWNRDKAIVVYCALYECDAGEKAYILLSCMGFTNVKDYSGGIKEWYQLGYPTQGPATYAFLHTKALLLPEDLIICSSQLKKRV